MKQMHNPQLKLLQKEGIFNKTPKYKIIRVSRLANLRLPRPVRESLIYSTGTYISMRVPVPRYLQTSKVSVKSLSLAFLFLLALFEISAFCCLRKCRTSKLDSKAFVSFTISILSWIHGVCKKTIIHI